MVHAADDDLRLLAELCDEAVARHGADIAKIERYVAEALTLLPRDKQQSLQNALSLFFSTQAALGSQAVQSSN